MVARMFIRRVHWQPESEIPLVARIASVRTYKKHVVEYLLQDPFSFGPMNRVAGTTRAQGRLTQDRHDYNSRSGWVQYYTPISAPVPPATLLLAAPQQSRLLPSLFVLRRINRNFRGTFSAVCVNNVQGSQFRLHLLSRGKLKCPNFGCRKITLAILMPYF